MAAQTNVTKYIIPDGMNISISADSGSTWYDIGLLAGGATMTHNFTKETINGGNKTKVIERVKDQTIALAPSALWSQDLEVFEKLGGGLYSRTAVAGSIVNNATQTVAANSWAYKKFIKIANQNYNGGAITVDSVTGATDGVLVADTDYYVGQNDKGEYGIYVLDSVTVTTLNQVLTIQYDYTPAASSYITAGTSVLSLTSFQVRMRHYTDTALTIYDQEVYIYSASTDAGIQFNFKGQNEEGLFETTMAFTGSLDESRTAGDQLFKWLIATSALN